MKRKPKLNVMRLFNSRVHRRKLKTCRANLACKEVIIKDLIKQMSALKSQIRDGDALVQEIATSKKANDNLKLEVDAKSRRIAYLSQQLRQSLKVDQTRIILFSNHGRRPRN